MTTTHPSGAKRKEAEAATTRVRDDSQNPPPFSSSPAPSYHSDIEDEEQDEDTLDLDQEISPDPDTNRPSVEYGLYHTTSLTHMVVCSITRPPNEETRKKPLYFAEVSEFTPKKPDVILRRVPDELPGPIADGSDLSNKQLRTGPIVGLARFPTFSRDFTIGFGDPSESELDFISETVRNAQRINHGQYDFFYTNTLHEGKNAAPVKYSWCRTHDAADGLDEPSKWKRKLNMRCWKLVDRRENKTIALVTANLLKRLRKEGKMVIYDGREKELEVMILLSFCGIAEKGRRRDNRRRSGGGGGGGGGGG